MKVTKSSVISVFIGISDDFRYSQSETEVHFHFLATQTESLYVEINISIILWRGEVLNHFLWVNGGV